MKVDIIMPVVVLPGELEEMARNAVLTCTRTCDASLYLMDNGGEPSPRRRAFGRWAKTLGHRYRFFTERPFNIWKYFNMGFERTAGPDAGEYVFFCGMDETFHRGWLDNLLDLWKENPEYYCLAPYTASTAHLGLFYRTPNAPPERRIVPCDHPAPGIHGVRRSEFVPGDESFPLWNSDYDFFEWMKANGKKGGICYNSRVDHLIGGVKDRAPEIFGFDVKSDEAESDLRFRKKWGKP